MNSEPSLLTPSEFNICPRTLTAPPLESVQATTMSPLRSCVTADRFWSPAIVVLTVCWDPSFAKLMVLSLSSLPRLSAPHGLSASRLSPTHPALPVGSHCGGDRLQRCPFVARKAPAVLVFRVQTHVTTIARAVSASKTGGASRLAARRRRAIGRGHARWADGAASEPAAIRPP